MKKLSLTAIIEKSTDGWYVGQIEEFPEAVSQGKSIDELKENLFDALRLIMETRKEKTQEQ
jgi:predicted RNase H-like HicB family nuclease